jgi:hypothetical protein
MVIQIAPVYWKSFHVGGINIAACLDVSGSLMRNSAAVVNGSEDGYISGLAYRKK